MLKAHVKHLVFKAKVQKILKFSVVFCRISKAITLSGRCIRRKNPQKKAAPVGAAFFYWRRSVAVTAAQPLLSLARS